MAADIFIHQLAVNESSSVGEGTRVWAFAHVMAGSVIGNHCNIGEHCFIEDGAVVGNGVTVKNGVAVWNGVELGDYVFVGPAAVFTNDLRPRSPRDPALSRRYDGDWLSRTRVEKGASIGANATVICGHRIGSYAMVAAGAVVTRDVAPHTLVMGSPARAVGQVCVCGSRLGGADERVCSECGRTYEQHGEHLRCRA